MNPTCSITLATALLTASAAPAQDSLERVEQGFEDLSPLARSLEFFQPQLQQPTGFESVYRVPGSDGLFMRRDGAVHAIFDRSEYIQTRHGTLPIAPAGTVYSIGPPSADLLASLAGRPNRSLVSAASTPARAANATQPSSLRVSNRIDPSSAPSTTTGIGLESKRTPAPTLWTNNLARQRTITSLFTTLQDSSPPPAPADD